jgi:dienelactone hydrolase
LDFLIQHADDPDLGHYLQWSVAKRPAEELYAIQRDPGCLKNLVTDPDQLESLEMPILGLFGAEDQGIPLDSVEAFSAALEDLGKEATIIVYPGADHAFANPSGHNYQPEAAEQAWQATIAFLAKNLSG